MTKETHDPIMSRLLEIDKLRDEIYKVNEYAQKIRAEGRGDLKFMCESYKKHIEELWQEIQDEIKRKI